MDEGAMCCAHRLARVTGVLVTAMVLTIGGLAGASPVQAASSSTLCKGFGDCADEGRSSGGYAPYYRRSFWNMRAGHNCTNYVAYRLTHGRLVARPPGANDASTWGPAARRAGAKVSRTPRVGAVAWWKAGYHGASKGGHVAYVEAVRPDGSIVISEDHLGGTFMWRRLTPGGSAWPSGFIEFPESDGSPAGKVLWAKPAGSGAIRFSATAGEPDVESGQRRYLVTVGGPRGTAGAESFEFTTPYFRFIRLKSLRTRGTTSLHVYALNTPGTAGNDALLGSRSITIR
jgi:surface antigen